MLGNIAKKIFGSKNDRDLKKLTPWVAQINSLGAKMEAMDDATLAAQTQRFKERLS